MASVVGSSSIVVSVFSNSRDDITEFSCEMENMTNKAGAEARMEMTGI